MSKQHHGSLIGRLTLSTALCWSGYAGYAQIYLPDASVTWPGSMSCEMAIPFCSTVNYTVDNPDDNLGFMWFTFQELNTEVVGLLFEGSEDLKYELYKAADIENPCGTLVTVFDNEHGYSYYHESTLTPGLYYIRVAFEVYQEHPYCEITAIKGLGCGHQECSGCLPPFSPIPGKDYVLSAWVKKDHALLGTINYVGPKIRVEAPTGTLVIEIQPSVDQPVVDDWQLMEGTFTMPMGATDFKLSLTCDDCTAFYDDVRVFPADGSMKCYVYDPTDLRFVAELDERHFATLYEYDREGKLMRVKKETERGVMTLQETQQSTFHVTP